MFATSVKRHFLKHPSVSPLVRGEFVLNFVFFIVPAMLQNNVRNLMKVGKANGRYEKIIRTLEKRRCGLRLFRPGKVRGPSVRVPPCVQGRDQRCVDDGIPSRMFSKPSWLRKLFVVHENPRDPFAKATVNFLGGAPRQGDKGVYQQETTVKEINK